MGLTAAGGSAPYINLTNTNTDANSPVIKFQKTATGADNDDLGQIKFIGDDEADAVITYANMLAEIADATPNEQAGRLTFNVYEHQGGGLQQGLLIDGDTNASGEVDVTIAAGAASTTTVAGTLTMGSTAAMTNAGLLSVAAQTNNGLWRHGFGCYR